MGSEVRVMMKTLVTGSAGMLANDLIPFMSQEGYEVHAPPEDRLDITDMGAVKEIVDGLRPELVINCAAYTNVDESEKNERQALMVNGLAVQNLCLLCQEHNIPLVHFSTDYVFDGTKESPYTIFDETNPINAYGRSKLLGEKYILWLLSKFYLIRTSWLFGLHGKNFIETMLELGQKRKQVSVVTDQRGCPTWSRHLAEATAALIQTGRYGIYHVTNSGPTTWFDFTREIFRLSGMKTEVMPVTSDKFSRPAKRPKNSVLDPFPFREVTGKQMPSWQDALKEYLSLRKGKTIL
jgi:dTDP-4-dehydrorhamnose reductase